MSATEELRRLLDERGVKYDTAATVVSGTVATFWHDRDSYPCSAIEGADDIPSGEVSVQACITPEQAVAATLGQRTCRIKEDADTGFLTCSECGAIQPEEWTVYYCWSCGAKVVKG